MKHYIVVKFKREFDYKSHLENITSIFNQVLDIDGISEVIIKKSNSDRKNRFDLMMEITMEKSALEAYDISLPHREWKEKYGQYIEQKAIFDCE